MQQWYVKHFCRGAQEALPVGEYQTSDTAVGINLSTNTDSNKLQVILYFAVNCNYTATIR